MEKNKINLDELDKILNKLIDGNFKNWDCDGATRFVSIFLTALNIKHKIFEGDITNKKTKKFFPIHFWIEIDNKIFDYKFKKWVGGNSTKKIIYNKHKEQNKKWVTLNNTITKEQIINVLINHKDNSILINKNGN